MPRSLRPPSTADGEVSRKIDRNRLALSRNCPYAASIVTSRSGTRLADWVPVGSEEEAVLVWEVLTAIMRAHPGDDGTRTAITADDRWLIVTHPAPEAIPTALYTVASHQAAQDGIATIALSPGLQAYSFTFG